VTLTGIASGPVVSHLSFAWSAPSGTFSSPNTQSTDFTCSAPGSVTVTLTTADGPVPAGASCDPSLATTTVLVQCDNADGGAVADSGADASAPDASASDAATDATAADAGAVDAATDAGNVDAAADTGAVDAAAGDAAANDAAGPDAGAVDAGAAINLAVYRVGDGVGAIANTGNPVFVDTFSTSGAPVGTIAMPTTLSGANHRLVSSGTAVSEGLITRSVNGKFLLLTGYDIAIPAASNIVSTAAATTPRVVGRIDAAGNVDTTTALSDFADGTNPRSAVSVDGSSFWVDGAGGGIRFAMFGATTSTQLSTTVVNLRQAEIFGSQLFVSDASGSAVRIGTVGSGLPTTAGQTITNLPGFPLGGSPYAFFLADLDAATPGLDTLYVADDSVGLSKYSLITGSWTLNGTVGSASDLYRGVTAVVGGTSVSLFAVRGGSQLVSLSDSSGFNGAFSATPTVLATAGTNMAYRGVALAPQP
jgi:hypothetical protein